MNLKYKYTTETYKTTCSVEDYYKNYVDICGFQQYCKQCDSYNKSWECPPHNCSIEDFWKSFASIDIYAVKLNYDSQLANRKFTSKELDCIIKNTLYVERDKLKKELLEIEKIKNGQYIHSGSCNICRKCSRLVNKPCNFPDKRRYSMDSIGTNVVKTAEDFFNFKIKWIKDNILPEYLTLVCAILY